MTGKVHALGGGQQRDHDRVERNKHGREEEQRQDIGPDGVPAGQRVPGQRAYDQVQDDSAAGNQAGIEKRGREIGRLQYRSVVFKGRRLRQREGRGNDFALVLEGIEHGD